MSEPIHGTRPGRHGARTSPGSPRRRVRRWKLAILAGLGLIAVLLALAGLRARGAFAHQMITVHGTERLVVNSFDGMSVAGAFPDIRGGTPVIVVAPSGEVIARGTLSPSDPSSWGTQNAVYAFTVTVPAGELRYGVEIGRNRGTIWLSERQMRNGPALSVSG